MSHVTTACPSEGQGMRALRRTHLAAGFLLIAVVPGVQSPPTGSANAVVIGPITRRSAPVAYGGPDRVGRPVARLRDKAASWRSHRLSGGAPSTIASPTHGGGAAASCRHGRGSTPRGL